MRRWEQEGAEFVLVEILVYAERGFRFLRERERTRIDVVIGSGCMTECRGHDC
jgi:hypothetical protein